MVHALCAVSARSMHTAVAVLLFVAAPLESSAPPSEIQSSRVVNARATPPFAIPPKDPRLHYLQFIAVGDAGTGGQGQYAVGRAMARKAAQDSIEFVLYLGDNFYESGISSVRDRQWKTKFEDVYSQPSLQVPFYAVLGNHDYRQNPQAQVEYTSLSARWKMPDRYYTFSISLDDSTSAQFFCLDTDPLSSIDSAEFAELNPASIVTQQVNWLQQELSISTARWRIAVGHHTMYSGGEHGDDPEMRYLLEHLFIRYRVDLYISGHDHHQEILKPVQGVYFIVSGAGGKDRDVTWGENTIYAGTNLGFAWFRLSRDELLVEFLNRMGGLEYAHVIRK